MTKNNEVLNNPGTGPNIILENRNNLEVADGLQEPSLLAEVNNIIENSNDETNKNLEEKTNSIYLMKVKISDPRTWPEVLTDSLRKKKVQINQI